MALGPDAWPFAPAGQDPMQLPSVGASHGTMDVVSDMDVEFDGPVVEWRGPAPFFFVVIPEDVSADIKVAARGVEYWGQVPVVARIGDTEFTTALFPKNGIYLLPLKNVVRTSVGAEVDQMLTVTLAVATEHGRTIDGAQA